MILKGNQRGGAKDLALHLMNDENEHVEVHELRGFASDNLMGALNEIYAISRGTRCKQFMYSLSLNPPPNEAKASIADFKDAIEHAEKRLNLVDHSRAIVFHEKEGRRHAHVVWSRIDTATMKAVRMSHDRTKLKSLSRELFLHHGWTMPEGLANSENRDHKNFTHAEWQQAKRVGKKPRDIKAAISDAWATSDSKASFVHALEERGYALARGDKTPYVAVDVHGEIYSIPKKAGVKTKEVRERLGDESGLRSVEALKAVIAKQMLSKFDAFRDGLSKEARQKFSDFERRRKTLVERQRRERTRLTEKQEQRRIQDNQKRQARFRKGLKGLWDRLRGEHSRIKRLNEAEATQTLERDRQEKEHQIQHHIDQRRQLDIFKLRLKQDYVRERRELARDRKSYKELGGIEPKGPESEY